jgi:hypothetical protein
MSHESYTANRSKAIDTSKDSSAEPWGYIIRTSVAVKRPIKQSCPIQFLVQVAAALEIVCY